jgi:1,2-diacylglycerol 3-beta-galactosyltransferase
MNTIDIDQYWVWFRFHHGVTRCYCPSTEVANRALLRGLGPSQVRVFGLPIRPSFCRAVLDKVRILIDRSALPCLPGTPAAGGLPYLSLLAGMVHTSQDEVRKELGLDPQLPAVLLMGGGEGMGPVEETARALGEELYDHRRRRRVGQVVVICGRNQALRSTLQSLRWKVPVKVGTMHEND